MNILIIEDELHAYEYLLSILKQIRPDVKVLAHLESVEEAINWFYKNDSADLIFMDIQLSDGLSFDIFNHCTINDPIIFTTAFDKYAIDAFKVNSIDYLLKPIHIEDLERAIEKWDKRHTSFESNISSQIQKMLDADKQTVKNRCLVKKGRHFEFIDTQEIAFINSVDGMTFLHTFDQTRHLYSKTIEGLIQILDQTTFFQINRGQIINIKAIEKIHPHFNQRMKIELQKESQIELIVSRSKASEFRKWMDS